MATIARKKDFKSECLFRMCSVATGLVTSPKNYSNLLCYYVVPFWPIMEQFCSHSFPSFSRTATCTATSEYKTVPERPSRNDGPNIRNEERTTNTYSSWPFSTSSTVSWHVLLNMEYWNLSKNFFFYAMNFLKNFQFRNILLICCLYYFLLCQRVNRHFDVHFRRNRPATFPSKICNDAACEGRNGWKSVFSGQSLNFFFVDDIFKVLFSICTLAWRVNNYAYRQGKGMSKKNEASIN